MRRDQRLIVSGITAAFLLALAQFSSPALAGGQLGRGKGPKCHREVFCDPQRCEQLVCPNSNDCQCYCEAIPNCTSAP